MSEVNFVVDQSALAVIQNTVIDGNFDEVKAALTEMVAPYASMIVTEDGIADAKADRAKLRKIESRIGDMRISVKKEYMKPFDDFAAKCNELIELCSAGSSNLDRQIKDFETESAQKKIDALHAEYAALTDGEMETYCPWDAIQNPKWANKGYSYETAVDEIMAAIERTRNDLDAIRDMGGDDTAALLDYYRQTRDLSAVVRKASDLKTMRQQEEQRARDAAERRAAMEKGRIAAVSSEPRNDAAEHTPDAEAGEADMYCVLFRVTCSKEQLIALGQFMKDHGIRYTKA